MEAAGAEPGFGMKAGLPTLLALALGLSASGAQADSGLPVPRFVTTAADEVNVRTGPGRQYPIEWVFTRRGFPVEIIDEFDTWRRIRDPDGVEGWVHQALLSGRRGMIVTGDAIEIVRDAPADAASPVVRAEAGVVGRVLECPPEGAENADWCRVELDGYRGWLPRANLWGVYPDEEVR